MPPRTKSARAGLKSPSRGLSTTLSRRRRSRRNRSIRNGSTGWHRRCVSIIHRAACPSTRSISNSTIRSPRRCRIRPGARSPCRRARRRPRARRPPRRLWSCRLRSIRARSRLRRLRSVRGGARLRPRRPYSIHGALRSRHLFSRRCRLPRLLRRRRPRLRRSHLRPSRRPRSRMFRCRTCSPHIP